jgi:hypothetical protein
MTVSQMIRSTSGLFLALGFLFYLLSPSAALAWGYQGHRVVGSIATELLNDNAKAKVKEILNPPGTRDPSPGNHEFDLRKAGPWADCVKAVAKNPDGTFKYKLNDLHPEYELPCIPFRDERAAMEDYASRNWSTCLYPADPAKPQLGCHNTFHFDDVALQRGSFDRTYQGTNEHDLLAAIGAMIAVLSDKPIPPPVPPSTFAFSIKDKREALLLLTHFIGDLHQPSVRSISTTTACRLIPILPIRSIRRPIPSAAIPFRTRTSICTPNGTTSRSTSAICRRAS